MSFRPCSTDGFEDLFIQGRIDPAGWKRLENRHREMRLREAADSKRDVGTKNKLTSPGTSDLPKTKGSNARDYY